MERVILNPTTEAEWLDMRKEDLTSTECAALFGCSPYLTQFELWHEKHGNYERQFDENERIKWGKRLESPIALGVAEDYGVVVEPMKCYMRIPDIRLGSSFDFRIIGLVSDWQGGENPVREAFRTSGPGIMEIKNVDFIMFRDGWIVDGDYIEAPPHIELQVQHQMEVADMNWCLIAALVAGNTPRIILRERDREIGAFIHQRNAEFWKMDVAPSPDYERDAAIIARLYSRNDGSTIDLTDDLRFSALCDVYKAAAADETAAKKRKEAAKAEITTIIGAAEKVLASGFRVTAGTVDGGHVSYNREPYRNIRITALKPAKAG